MKKVLKLTAAFLREHPARVVLTSLAAAAAACMVVWVAGSYDALLKTFDQYANLALGRYSLAVAPISAAKGSSVPPEVVAELRADPAVAGADPMWALRARVVPILPAGASEPAAAATAREPAAMGGMGMGGMGMGGGPPRSGPPRPVESILLATDAPQPPFDLLRGRWIAPGGADRQEIAVRADVAQELRLDVGSEVQIQRTSGGRRVKVVGVFAAPTLPSASSTTILTPSSGEYYLSTPLAAEIFGGTPRIDLVGVALQPEADLTKFRFGWAPRLNRFSTPVQFQEAHEIEEALDQAASAQNVRLQSYAATGVAMLAAMLVIFCTLSMGVTERIRQYAVLRAVTFTRGEVALLIALEALFLGAVGFVGGVAAAAVLLQLTAWLAARLLHHGASLGGVSLLLAAVATFGGAFLASLLPAWRATRVRPVDAMAPPSASVGEARTARWVLPVGLLLTAVNPLLTFVFPPSESAVLATMAVGFTTMAAGFVLIAPATASFVDRWVGPLLARLLFLDPKLLASQITNNLWRTVGAAISLAVGMGLFIGIQVWAATMLQAFIPGSWTPDAVLAFRGGGLSPEQAAQVVAAPGVDPARAQPIVVEQPRLLDDVTGSAGRASVTRQDNVVLVGVDPVGGFEGPNALLPLEWTAGSPESAVRRLREGHACVVPDHFLLETGLKLGDAVAMVPPEDPAHPVRYEIAGAVRLPGWHWQTKVTGFRTRTHRAAALIFADYASVAKDFGLKTASHVWFSYAPGADPDGILAAARAIYVTNPSGEEKPAAASGAAKSVELIPVATIRDNLRRAAVRWTWVASWVPLVALGIAGLGVLNVILASVRARRWEMGVLRALGFTNATLVRAIVAEGLLIGFLACLLSLGFGVLAGWCGSGAAQYFSFFGGLHPSLTIPWAPVGLGLLGVLALAATAAVWPAVSIGRTRPLALLQESRGTF